MNLVKTIKGLVLMFCRRLLLCWIILLISACASDAKIFGYTLWGSFDYNPFPSSVVVRQGDTLYSIARSYDVPLREVIELNRLQPPYTLRIGQVINLPTAKYHIVEKGDTLYNISKRYNVDMPTLSRTNNLSAPFTLKIGQKLLLPGSIVTGQTPVKTTSTTSTTKTTSTSTAKKQATKTQAKSTPVKTAATQTYKQPSTTRKQKFSWPVKGEVISKFGPIAKGRNNDGINIKAAKGTTVKAADAGTVAYAGNELKGFGNLILIKHSDGWVTAYAHNDTITVKKGQQVARGAAIGTVGTSGGVNTPQLHFETRAGKKALNPLSYLQ